MDLNHWCHLCAGVVPSRSQPAQRTRAMAPGARAGTPTAVAAAAVLVAACALSTSPVTAHGLGPSIPAGPTPHRGSPSHEFVRTEVLAPPAMAPTPQPTMPAAECLVAPDAEGNVVVPAKLNVTTITPDMFQKCHTMRTLTLPNTVTTIGKGALAVLANLSMVYLPDSLQTIGEGALACTPGSYKQCTNCTPGNLGPVFIPSRRNYVLVDYFAFFGCRNMTAVYLNVTPPSNGMGLNAGAFSYTGITAVNLKNIGQEHVSFPYTAFTYTNLTYVNLDRLCCGQALLFGDCYFCCTNVTSLYIPDGIGTQSYLTTTPAPPNCIQKNITTYSISPKSTPPYMGIPSPCPELPPLKSGTQVYRCKPVSPNDTFLCSKEGGGMCVPSPDGKGMSLGDCIQQEALGCGLLSYSCVNGDGGRQCVATNDTRITLDECQHACLAPTGLFVCIGDGRCVPSVDPTIGSSKSECMTKCRPPDQ